MKVFLVSILALVIAVGGGCGGKRRDTRSRRKTSMTAGSEAEVSR